MESLSKSRDGSRNSPKGSMFAVSVMYTTAALCETVLYPFTPLMVANFHVTEDPRKLGYYAGFIAGSYYLGVLLSSGFWGGVSDRIGRKPVLLFSTLTSGITSLIFGFSPSLSVAMVARFCNGLFSGIYPVGKTVVAELSDTRNQSSGFAVIGLSWGIGLLLGPALGGILSQPGEKYSWFVPHGSLLYHFPFALPCILLTSLSFFSLGLLYFSLPETLGRLKSSTILDPPTSLKNSEEAGCSKGGTSETKEFGSSVVVEGQLLSHVKTDPSLSEPLISKGEKREGIWRIMAPWVVLLSGRGKEEDRSLSTQDEQSVSWWKAVFFHRETVVSTMIYSLLGFACTSQNDVFPLWCVTNWTFGGLGIGTSEVGFIQAASGLALIPYQMLIYPAIANRLGTLNSLRWSLFGMILVGGFPLLRFFPSKEGLLAGGLIIMMIRGVTCATAFTSVTIAINNSVRNPEFLGAVNGMSQTVTMLFQSSAPIAGASLYAWSISSQHFFPFDFHFYWCLWVILCLVMMALTTLLPRSIDHRKFMLDYSGLE